MPEIKSDDLGAAKPEAKDVAEKIATSGTSPDVVVRDAADRLRKAIADARAAGFVVDFKDEVLGRIPISATAKVAG